MEGRVIGILSAGALSLVLLGGCSAPRSEAARSEEAPKPLAPGAIEDGVMPSVSNAKASGEKTASSVAPGANQTNSQKTTVRTSDRLSSPSFYMTSDSVKTELALTLEQRRTLDKLLPPVKSGPQMQDPDEAQAKRDETDSKILEMMDAKQIKRLNEIMLQFEGPRALTRPEIAEKLGLTTAQRQKIEGIFNDLFASWRRSGDMDRYRTARDDANEKVLDTLTKEQRAQWEKMLGKPIEFRIRTSGMTALNQSH